VSAFADTCLLRRTVLGHSPLARATRRADFLELVSSIAGSTTFRLRLPFAAAASAPAAEPRE